MDKVCLLANQTIDQTIEPNNYFFVNYSNCTISFRNPGYYELFLKTVKMSGFYIWGGYFRI